MSSLTRRPTTRASSTSPMPTSTMPRSLTHHARAWGGRPSVFDKGLLPLWAGGPRSLIRGAVFITRPKTNMRLDIVLPGRALLRIAAPAAIASRSRSSASPIWSPCASSNGAHLGAIDKPPAPSTQSRPKCQKLQKSIQFHLCLSFPGQPCRSRGEGWSEGLLFTRVLAIRSRPYSGMVCRASSAGWARLLATQTSRGPRQEAPTGAARQDHIVDKATAPPR